MDLKFSSRLTYLVLGSVAVLSGGCQAGPEAISSPAPVASGPLTANAYVAIVENGRVTVKHEMVTVEQARWVRETRRANRAGGVSGGPVQQALIASSTSWSDCSNFSWTYFQNGDDFYCIKYVSGTDWTGVYIPFTPTYIDGSTSHYSALCSASSDCWRGENPSCHGSNVITFIGVGEWIPSYSGGGNWAWIGPLMIC
jgi:hypothetical protein